LTYRFDALALAFAFAFALALGRVATGGPTKRLTFSSVACASVWLIWRFAAAATWERADPAILFAALSHMLMKGFFFNQGLLM
jgi:hypothetical protein